MRHTTFAFGASSWGRSIADANNVSVWVTGDPGNPYGSQLIRAPDGTTTTLTDPDTGADLLGIPGGSNTSGAQVGDFRYPIAPGQRRGYILGGGSLTMLHVPGANITAARGINDAGDVVGFYSDDSGGHAFLYRGGAFDSVDHPGAAVQATYLQDINDSGMAVGSWFDVDDRQHPFLYDTNTGAFEDIDVPNGLSLNAWGMDNQGRVVISSAGGLHGAVSFLYDPNAVPEPQVWALMILGMGLAGTVLRRRKSAPGLGV